MKIALAIFPLFLCSLANGESLVLSESPGVSDDEDEKGFGYDYLEIGIQSNDGGDFRDRNSFSLNFSKSLQESIYLTGSLGVSPAQDAGNGFEYLTTVSASVGGGAHFSVTGATDIFAEAAFVSVVQDDGFGSDANGFGLRYGIRQKIVESFELQVSRLSLNLEDFDSQEITEASAIFNVSDSLSLRVGALGEDFDFDAAIGFGLRISI
jgi:hypothetical protein